MRGDPESRLRVLAALTVLTFGAFAPAPAGPADAEPPAPIELPTRRLSTGATTTASLDPGQEQRFRLEVPEDEYAVLAVEGDEDAPDATLQGRDSSTLAQGRERVFFLRGGSGVHVLSLRSEADAPAPRRYRIVAFGSRALPSRQSRYLKAERSHLEGRFGVSVGTPAALHEAVARLRAARELWRGLQEPAKEAASLEELALAHARLAEHDEARRYLGNAAQLWKGVGDPRGESRNLRLRAAVEAHIGDNRTARDLAQEALARARKDPLLEAQALNALAAARAELGETQEALNDFAQALTRSREAKDAAEEARALSGLGQVRTLIGEYQQALEALPRALEAWRSLGDKGAEATVLGNLGALYLTLGHDEEAESYFADALERAGRQSDRILEIHALLNVGAVHEIRGDLGPARASFDKALELSRALDHQGLAARALHRLGRIGAAEGRTADAIGHYERALALQEAAGNPREVAAVLADLGRAHTRGDPARALADFSRGADLARASADGVQEAANLIGMAMALQQQGDLEGARRQAEEALARIETQRAKTDRLELRSSHLASRQDYYELYVELLMQLEAARPGNGHAAAALHAVEHARARGLLDMLGEGREQIRVELPPDLRERERRVREQLSARTAQQLRLSTSTTSAAPEARRLAGEIRALLREHEQVQEEVRAANPRYAALTQPVPLDVAQIQAQVLDDDTALLSYALGRERSYAWLVTRTSLASFALPPRAEIETLARRAYPFLANPRHRAEGDGAERDLDAATRALSAALLAPLPAPAVRRLLVVAEGALQHIPFAALPDPWVEPVGSGPDPGPRPLIERYEIVSASSASVVALLRSETPRRPSASRTLAVFADPVFEASDPRVKREGEAAGPGSHGDDSLARLPYTRDEAQAALKLVAPDQGFLALDFAADRAAALNPSLAEYRVVHFATHGILNTRHPELSGLALSLVDEKGRPRDGFLSLQDVYNLRLSADLVVLSGCRTGVGKEIRGEGLLGLTRGFIYAGAPRAIASLWSVSDRGTTELMTRFYEKLLRDGLPAAAALREAQRALRREPRWSHPHYWSGFVLFGEWR